LHPGSVQSGDVFIGIDLLRNFGWMGGWGAAWKLPSFPTVFSVSDYSVVVKDMGPNSRDKFVVPGSIGLRQHGGKTPHPLLLAGKVVP